MKKVYKVLLIVLVVLIGARIYLPVWLENYVNKVLDEVPGYTGSVENIDLHLFRGGGQADELTIVRTEGELPVPFLDVERIDVSIDWKALFKGKLVVESEVTRPELNIVVSAFDSGQVEQTGMEADWTIPAKKLMPLNINRFSIVDGRIAYHDYSSDPVVDISLDSLQVEALNLSNVENQGDTLPSTITMSATSIGGGKLNLTCRADVLKKIPDLDLSLEFEEVYLPALNDFANGYARIDFEKGTFYLYTEMVVSDGILTGYVKPMMTDVKVLDLSEEKDPPLKIIWEGAVGFIADIFKNPPNDQFASQIPLNGDVNNPKTNIWVAIGSIFKNAFVEAFEKDTDNSVSFEDLKQ